MWNPFKRTLIKGCINCEYCKAVKTSMNYNEYYCKRTIKEIKEHDRICGKIRTEETHPRECSKERSFNWFNFFHCGQSGRFFRDKIKWE